MRRREQPLYSESQAFQHWQVRVALAIPPLAVLAVTCRQMIWHEPWTSPPLSNGELVFLTILLAAVYVRLNTVRLVTEVLPDELVIALRGIWKRRRIQVRKVRSVAVVRYDPAGDFGGYGIRTGRQKTAYIARGNQGVELAIEGGEKILIGSQHPDELAMRIQEGLARVKV